MTDWNGVYFVMGLCGGLFAIRWGLDKHREWEESQESDAWYNDRWVEQRERGASRAAGRCRCSCRMPAPCGPATRAPPPTLELTPDPPLVDSHAAATHI